MATVYWTDYITTSSTTGSYYSYANTSAASTSYYVTGQTFISSYEVPLNYSSWEIKETEEQKVAREAQYEASMKKQMAEEEERKAAVAKAEQLLKDHIGLERFGSLYQTGHLEVDSQKHAGRKYRVSKNAYDKIQVMDGEKVIDELCIVPTVQCPEGDRLLSKIVLLECDEDYVLATANHFPRN